MRNSIDVNLNIEKIIYVVFIIISVMGIIGTNYEEKFIETGDSFYHEKGGTIFKITIVIALIIYLYCITEYIES